MIIAILLMAVIVIGILGYNEAREIKMQAEQIEKITARTLNLTSVRENEFEIPVKDWENAGEKAEFIKTELDKFDRIQETLKEDFRKFYSEQALKRFKEAEFLQFLIDGQRKIDLQDEISEKSKGQIETVLADTGKFKNNFNQYKLFFADSDFDPYLLKLQTEEMNFENYLKGLYGKITYDSKKVTVKTASFNGAFKELKTKLIESLNDWVALQEKIKKEISKMGNDIWINPFHSSPVQKQ